MKGANVAPGEIVPDAGANLVRRFSIVGKHEDLFGQDTAVVYKVRDLADDHASLAGSRASEYQSDLLVGCDRFGLFVGRFEGERRIHCIADRRNCGRHETTVHVCSRALEIRRVF